MTAPWSTAPVVNCRPDASPITPITVERIDLPWSKPPLSMNDRGASRGAMYAKASTVKTIRDTTMILARNVKRPSDAAFLSVQLHYLPNSNARRDTDNLIASAKPIYDALAKGTRAHPGLGLVKDDTPQFMGKPEPVIWPHRKGDVPAMWLELVWWESVGCPWVAGCECVPGGIAV